MLRRVFFQLHLWTGIGVGLYVVLISLTGSIVVFRREVYTYFRPGTIVVPRGERLSQDALSAAATRVYPGFRVTHVQIRRRQPTIAAEVWLEDRTKALHRLFDPYSGADLGDAEPAVTRWFEKVADLHNNLLSGRRGRTINGIGGLCVSLLCVTGAVIWWPGLGQLRRGMTVRFGGNWKRLNWDLHSALGFWSLAMIFMWALTGVYLAFPRPFQAVVDYLQAGRIEAGATGPGDEFLAWFINLHFGRFAGLGTRVVWGVLGLVPPVLFVTGAIMWWNRVVAPQIARRGENLQLTIRN